MVQKLEAEFAAREAENSLRGRHGPRSHDRAEAAAEEALMALLERRGFVTTPREAARVAEQVNKHYKH
eukprot:COSAG05_NODE_4688_length_1408_cov_1.627196_2_plen_68_part_00